MKYIYIEQTKRIKQAMSENSPHKLLSKRELLLNKADALALEADQLSYQGKYEEAVERYDQALAIYPSNSDLWAFKAITLSGGLGRNDEALECWERAKKLDHVLADAITDLPSSDKITVNERDLVDFKGSTADRIRNLVKQQAMDKKKK
jgi:tetratricopeptide (TPR) repeat protein